MHLHHYFRFRDGKICYYRGTEDTAITAATLPPENLSGMAPILPGKLAAWHEFREEMNGPRRAEHEASRQRMGARREVASLLQTPMAFPSAFTTKRTASRRPFVVLATSQEPYDVWFRERLADIHGLTQEMLSEPPSGVKMFEWPARVCRKGGLSTAVP